MPQANPSTFPSTWRHYKYFRGPYPANQKSTPGWANSAAKLASEAWIAAQASGDWQRIDGTCFKLAVCDKAQELHEGWTDGPDYVIFKKHAEWVVKLEDFIRATYALGKASLEQAARTNVKDFTIRVFNLEYNGPLTNARQFRLRPAMDIEPDEYGDFDPNDAWARGEFETRVHTFSLDDMDDKLGGKTDKEAEVETSWLDRTSFPLPKKRRREQSTASPTSGADATAGASAVAHGECAADAPSAAADAHSPSAPPHSTDVYAPGAPPPRTDVHAPGALSNARPQPPARATQGGLAVAGVATTPTHLEPLEKGEAVATEAEAAACSESSPSAALGVSPSAEQATEAAPAN